MDARRALGTDPAAWDTFVAATPLAPYLQATPWAAVKAGNRWRSRRVIGVGGSGLVGGQLLMHRIGPLPWSVTFSYGRALQETALQAWGGRSADFKTGQQEFARRARLNGLASQGRYTPDMERAA